MAELVVPEFLVVIDQMVRIRDWIGGAGEVFARGDGTVVVHYEDIGDNDIFCFHLKTNARRIEVVKVHIGGVPASLWHVGPPGQLDSLFRGPAGGDVEFQVETAIFKPFANRNVYWPGGRTHTEHPVVIKPAPGNLVMFRAEHFQDESVGVVLWREITAVLIGHPNPRGTGAAAFVD